MKTRRQPFRGFPRARRGFTVLELLLAVSILTIIVGALYTVFDQTQKAMRSSMRQVDVLESGRAAMDLIVRDLEQTVRTGVNETSAHTNSSMLANYTSFYAGLYYALGPQNNYAADTQFAAVEQKLVTTATSGPASNRTRTNFLQEIYFPTRENNYFVGHSYFVSSTNRLRATSPFGVGTLYRVSWTPSYRANETGTNLLRQLESDTRGEKFRLNATNTAAMPVIEGVVHFHVRTFDRAGRPVEFPTLAGDLDFAKRRLPDRLAERSRFPAAGKVDSETSVTFSNDTLPRYVDVELGILEPQVLEQLKAIYNANNPQSVQRARDFLAKKAANVHLFRQRILLRAAAP